MELADRVTVMRDGKVVGTVLTRESSEKELARLMVGRDVELRANRKLMERGLCGAAHRRLACAG